MSKMLIKIIGSFAIVTAGGVCALSLCRYHKRRLETLEGFISLIYYIKGQVECYARPIGEILQALPPEILRDCNCPEGADSLEELVSESRHLLDRESDRLLRAFCAEFGNTFREEQGRRCEHYASQLCRHRAAISEHSVSDMRAASAICLCACLCLTILLW